MPCGMGSPASIVGLCTKSYIRRRSWMPRRRSETEVSKSLLQPMRNTYLFFIPSRISFRRSIVEFRCCGMSRGWWSSDAEEEDAGRKPTRLTLGWRVTLVDPESIFRGVIGRDSGLNPGGWLRLASTRGVKRAIEYHKSTLIIEHHSSKIRLDKSTAELGTRNTWRHLLEYSVSTCKEACFTST